MNTVTTSLRLVWSLLLIAILASPAFAQQNLRANGGLGNEAIQGSSEISELPELSEIIDDLHKTEYLPIVHPVLTRVEWDAYGEKLEHALASGHKGLQHAALRLVIAYGEEFNLSEAAVFDVMRIYRDGDTERVRRMAVVTLAEMDSEWAMKFLARSVRFEKSDQVRQTIQAVLYRDRQQNAAL